MRSIYWYLRRFDEKVTNHGLLGAVDGPAFVVPRKGCTNAGEARGCCGWWEAPTVHNAAINLLLLSLANSSIIRYMVMGYVYYPKSASGTGKAVFS